ELGEMDLGDATITDVGSTKQQVCAAASRLLADPGCFIGSHPMAGGEQHGPSAARADLFGEKPCIITPGENASETRLALVESLWQTLGMRTMRMSAADHDRTVAQISHLPHLAAVLLVELAARGGAMDVASTGFADTTRVASGDPGLWADIFETNRDAMVAAIDTLCDDLNGFKQLLAGKDTASLLELLERAKTARDQWMQSSRLDSETAEQ
ncbi:MAG: prephenate dehydrogenase/arogenate dehydrogenase family protein, partial [Phycisphaeraceae bacterium]|nr:prephenate dehydrogenase/arogenate dehydrogenase family protein [Phycisphaeraceae bacterium]